MKFKDYIVMTVFSLFLGYFLVNSTAKTELPTLQDTVIVQDTVTSVKGKRALIIGDSHSVPFYGWVNQVCDKTGMSFSNLSVSSKNTTWMLQLAHGSVHQNLDYVFVYGGANDWDNKLAIKNLQSIIDLCNKKGVHCIIVVGFDAEKVCDNRTYGYRYGQLQDMMVTSLHGAQVLDTRGAVVPSNCVDNVCHMSKAGQTRLANEILKLSKFQVIK
jgi:hypothetical protein